MWKVGTYSFKMTWKLTLCLEIEIIVKRFGPVTKFGEIQSDDS